jgi:inosine-uridine nucleoside N-ribohydrolase
MKGWREYFNPGTDAKRSEYPYPYGTMIKEYMQWNNLEDTVTDGVDKIIAYSNHRWKGDEDINMKVIPRVFLVWVEPWHGGIPQDPSNKDDVNGWHWPSDMVPEYDSPYREIPDRPGFAYVPAKDSLVTIKGGYFDSNFKFRVQNLVKKLGEAWDNDPRVAYVEMGIIGEWGEQHDPDISTFWLPHEEAKHFANRTWVPGIEKVLGDAFTKAFKNKKVMVRYAYEFKDYDFGIYWDSWAIDEEINRGYNAILGLGDRWKTEPIGGEITWNWGSLKADGFKNLEDCVNNDKARKLIIKQIRNLHCNHLGGITWADFHNDKFADNAALIQKALGYRYVISKCSYPNVIKSNKDFNVSFEVTNTGSSPFYYKWPVQLELLDKNTHEIVWRDTFDTDIRNWMPGEKWDSTSNKYIIPPQKIDIKGSFKIDDSVEDGTYVLALSILDPAGMLPSVRFANINYFNGGFTPLCYIGVNEKESESLIPDALFDDPQKDTMLHYVLKPAKTVIFDTDLGNDVDDVLALQMLLNYEKEGKVNLKGITISKSNLKSVEFVDGYCRFNNRNHIPIGYVYNGCCPDDNTYLDPTINAVYKGKKILHPKCLRTDSLPVAYKLMRKLLVSQPDSSVVVISTGPLTNLARLLESEPDEISPENGSQLVSQKVSKICLMGGDYVSKDPEWNIKSDIHSAQIVFDKCPVPLVASGYEIGNQILFPHEVIMNDLGNPDSNPLCIAYVNYMKMPYDRQCWDLTTVLDAVEGDKNYFSYSPSGNITVTDSGVTTLKVSKTGKQKVLVLRDAKQIENVKETLVDRVIK